MTIQEIIREIEVLNHQELKLLLTVISERLTEPGKAFDLLDFAGVGAHLADDTDPQDYINQLRSEWDQQS